MNTIAQAPRDFNYIKPRKRRLSEYEAVSCYSHSERSKYEPLASYCLLIWAAERVSWHYIQPGKPVQNGA
jgi:hypothetical protein